jgi:hypothetical protein
MRAVDGIREVYGIRRVSFNEKQQTVRVEFDASRFKEPVVANLLRRAGLDILERVALAWESGKEPCRKCKGRPRKPLAEVILKCAPLRATSSVKKVASFGPFLSGWKYEWAPKTFPVGIARDTESFTGSAVATKENEFRQH